MSLAASGELEGAAAALARLDAVESATTREGGIDLMLTDASARLPLVLAEAAAAGASVRSVEVVEPDLEAVFLTLTGKALRD